MKTFTDNLGRQWNVSMSVAALKRVRDLVGIDLMELPTLNKAKPEESLIHRFGTDPVLLVDVLYCLVKPQADEAGISDEGFAEGLGGDVLEQATDAFMQEALGFFRGGVRDALLTVMDKAKRADKLLLDRLAAMVADPALDQAIDAAVAEAVGMPSTAAPESSDSTPAH